VVATSQKGLTYDGQVEVESVAMSVMCGGSGVAIQGPVIEVKGRLKQV